MNAVIYFLLALLGVLYFCFIVFTYKDKKEIARLSQALLDLQKEKAALEQKHADTYNKKLYLKFYHLDKYQSID